jgi:hypothetical protein
MVNARSTSWHEQRAGLQACDREQGRSSSLGEAVVSPRLWQAILSLSWNIGRRARVFVPFVGALCVIACGARSIEVSESNTNWLAGCDKAADCGNGMACECGVCTKNCAEDACPAQLECLAECGSGGSCQKACDDDAGCASLSESAECRKGVCQVTGGVSDDEVEHAVEQPSTADSSAFWVLPTASSEAVVDAGPSCRVAYVDYPAGTRVPMDGCGNTTCLCDASGELVECGGILLPCGFVGNGPIKSCDEMFPDGDVASDSLSIDDAFILGNTLTLDVSHSGGCARHDYAMCFEHQPEAVQRYALKVVHDAHADGCEASLETTLQFDLSPMGQHLLDRLGTAGTYILTSFGVFTFGEPTCGESGEAARIAVLDLFNTVDTSCEEDEDCVSTRLTADCTEECNGLSNTEQSALLDRLRDNLAAGACAGYLERGCTPVFPLCERRDAVCRDGTCSLADP